MNVVGTEVSAKVEQSCFDKHDAFEERRVLSFGHDASVKNLSLGIRNNTAKNKKFHEG